MVEDSDAKASEGGRVISQSDGRGGGEVEDRVKGPWSPEEDAVLSRLVAKFGARNWSLIARGIPGRSGKSCRLRWCNQLDPSVKHKPFTDQEDMIIIAAHAVHGNKWAVIARLLQGRTDNAIKNHWNSTLRRRCIEIGKFKKIPTNSLEDVNITEKMKASSEETQSNGEGNSLKSSEGKDVDSSLEKHVDSSLEKHVDSSLEKPSDYSEDKSHRGDDHPMTEAEEPPTLVQPRARLSAFSPYNPTGGTNISILSKPIAIPGPSTQTSKPNISLSNPNGVYIESQVPSQCGHGCCCGAKSSSHSRSSLLGPEFVEFVGPPPISNQELASLATDLGNIAWLQSGLRNNGSLLPITSHRT